MTGSTTLPKPDAFSASWDRRIRRTSVTLIVTTVTLAAVGLLGVNSARATNTDNGYSLAVQYARITRPGLATPFSIEVTTLGGELPSDVTVRVSSEYLAMFDANGIEPTPASSFNDGNWTDWRFEVPAGQAVLRVDFDGRLEPSVQWARSGTVAVIVDDHEVVATSLNTWVAP